MRTYYDVLGISRTAGGPEIKAAYRRLAMEWHPDRNPRPDATVRFREINEAYQCLCDTETRRRYDAELRRQEANGAHAHAGAHDFRHGCAESPECLSCVLARLWHELDQQLGRLPERVLDLFTRIDAWLRRRANRA